MADHTDLVAPPLDIPDPAGLVLDLEEPSQPLEVAVERPSGLPHPLTLRVFRPVMLAKLAFLVGLFVFAPFLIQRLPDLSARSEYRLNTKDIQLIPEPEKPIPATLVDQVRRQNQLPGELSLLDPNLCETLATAFSNHPWIARVVSVQSVYPAAVVVRVEYRQPVAMVQVKGGRVPIDATGSVLPGEDFDLADVSRFPTIRMSGSASLTRRAGQFNEPGLTGAVQVAELLGPKWNSLKLEAIELPRLREQPENSDDISIVLQTKDGSSILWGRAPGTNHPGELSPPQKVARLEKYLAQFGGFDRPGGPYEIDIRHWQEITRRPSTKTQASSRKETRSRR